MLIVIIAIFLTFLVLILLAIAGNSARKRQEEQAKLQLTAEHQRLQREKPEHPDAKMGFEEFFLSRLNELQSARKRNLKVVLRYGGIGAILLVLLFVILEYTRSHPIGHGPEISFGLILGLSFFGMSIGAIIGSIVVFFKHGTPKIRVKTE